MVIDVDGFSEIEVFTRVVDAHGFTRAGDSLGLTASGVSRIISRLESRLGVRLINRTTRSSSLTDEGAVYYERCTRILAELEDANRTVARARNEPRGRLRVDAPPVLGRHLLGPAIPRLLGRYPELSLDLTVRDELIDPIAEGIDVTVRLADLEDSELVSKRLGTFRLVVVASPRYLAKRGRPKSPADLRQHETVGFLSNGSPVPWR
ncbi:MAG: LysR family transcriptional regulator, partial [Polyangiaceae bacterium]